MHDIKTDSLFDLTRTLASELLAQFPYPWEALDAIKGYILQLGPTLSAADFDHPKPDIWIHKYATVAPTASLNGPLIIDAEAEIRHCAYIRGSAIVGKGAVVGNSCELKNCVLFDGVQVPHFNYVGDSILGYKAHMGAGSITSNVKSDKTDVIIRAGGQEFFTGRHKLGAMLGDYAEVGAGSVLNPGAIVGKNAIVYPMSCLRGWVPEHSIYKEKGVIVPREERD